MAEHDPLKNSLGWVTFRAIKEGESAKAGTVLGDVPCHACGGATYARLDKNLKCYAYCNSHHPENVNPCGSSMKWNRADSARLIAAWAKRAAAAPQPIKEITDEKATTANVTRAKSPSGKRAPGTAAAKREPEPEPKLEPVTGGASGRHKLHYEL